MVDKQALRTAYLTKRKALSHAAYTKRNKELEVNFNSFLASLNFQYLHSFLPILKNKEVNTWPLIAMVQQMEKQVVISKSDLSTNLLTHYLFESKLQLANNKWGIPEPQSGQIVSVDQLDIVLIPLLIFDEIGHRVGYGKGYYDRFLQECRSDTIKVGLSLFAPIQKIDAVESHDIKLDYCLTPEDVYQF